MWWGKEMQETMWLLLSLSTNRQKAQWAYYSMEQSCVRITILGSKSLECLWMKTIWQKIRYYREKKLRKRKYPHHTRHDENDCRKKQQNGRDLRVTCSLSNCCYIPYPFFFCRTFQGEHEHLLTHVFLLVSFETSETHNLHLSKVFFIT